jgi:uncharacterized protein (TIGR01777 family)
MNILITGGTGFIGSALCSRLLDAQHHLVVLSRHPETIKPPVQGIESLDHLTDEIVFNAVINLAGEPIVEKRWSDRQKQRILSSRLDTTQALIEYFARIESKPKVFISGSAIGYYGTGRTNDPIDETGVGDDSFSSQICRQWEAVALQAQSLGIRTCLLRTGIVLGQGGGALAKMLGPFKLGAGGRMGSGTQWMSWIHINDLIGIILYCMEHDSIEGPVNGTAPTPVTNQQFTKTLGKVLNRPTFFSMPGAVITLLMGQMGKELLLTGKKILPRKIQTAGYAFQYSTLEHALSDVV